MLYNVPRWLQTPPQSLDLNPVIIIYGGKLEKQTFKCNITPKNDLIFILKEKQAKITPFNTAKLVHLMNKTLQAVIKHKG